MGVDSRRSLRPRRPVVRGPGAGRARSGRRIPQALSRLPAGDQECVRFCGSSGIPVGEGPALWRCPGCGADMRILAFLTRARRAHPAPPQPARQPTTPHAGPRAAPTDARFRRRARRGLRPDAPSTPPSPSPLRPSSSTRPPASEGGATSCFLCGCFIRIWSGAATYLLARFPSPGARPAMVRLLPGKPRSASRASLPCPQVRKGRLDFLSLTGLPHAPRRSTFPPSPPATRSAPR